MAKNSCEEQRVPEQVPSPESTGLSDQSAEPLCTVSQPLRTTRNDTGDEVCCGPEAPDDRGLKVSSSLRHPLFLFWGAHADQHDVGLELIDAIDAGSIFSTCTWMESVIRSHHQLRMFTL